MGCWARRSQSLCAPPYLRVHPSRHTVSHGHACSNSLRPHTCAPSARLAIMIRHTATRLPSCAVSGHFTSRRGAFKLRACCSGRRTATNASADAMTGIVRVADSFINLRGSFKIGPADIGVHSSLVKRKNGKWVMLDSMKMDDSMKAEVLSMSNGGKDVEAILNVHPFHTVRADQSVPALLRHLSVHIQKGAKLNTCICDAHHHCVVVDCARAVTFCTPVSASTGGL